MVGRVRAGVELAGKSWRVVRSEPSTVIAMLVGTVVAWALGLGAFVAVFGRLPSGKDMGFPRFLSVFPFLWLVSFCGNCVACFVASLVDARLRNEPITSVEAARRTASKLGRILSWTLLAGLVGLVLYLIAERLRLAGRVAQWLVGLGWDLATTFVIPVLVLEDVSVRQSVRRSASLFKRTWAEKVSADVMIGLVTLVAFIPVAAAVVGVAFVSVPAAIVIGALLLSLFIAVTNALDTALDVATYQYALDGRLTGGFSESDFLSLYKPA